MNVALQDGFLLHDCKIEPLKGLVTNSAGAVQNLAKKPMDVLVHLALHAGEVVTKQQLVDEVWGRHAGGGEGLKKCIHAIRKALTDDNQSPRFIQTIHGRGYLCLPAVTNLNTNVIELDLPKLREVHTRTSLPVPGFKGRPAVAVLPFSCSGDFGELENEIVAEGMAEDIIGSLQRYHSHPIISHHSSNRYGGEAADFNRISNDLGVGYIVGGSMRAARDRVKITVNLTATDSYAVVWSNSYVCGLDELINIDTQITEDIAAQLEPEIQRAEAQKKLPADLTNIEAWQFVRRASWHLHRLSKNDAIVARKYLDKALEIDPNYPDALLQKAWLEWWTISAVRGSGIDWEPLETLAKKAQKADAMNPRAPLMLGIFAIMHREHDVAISHFKSSLKINPSFGWAHSHMGSALYLSGKPELALKELQIAARISPFDHYMFHTFGDMAICELMLENWDKAIDAANTSLALRPNYWWAQLVKICALAHINDLAGAKSELAKLLERRPSFGADDINWMPFADRSWNKMLATCLSEIADM